MMGKSLRKWWNFLRYTTQEIKLTFFFKNNVGKTYGADGDAGVRKPFAF